jgi:hypothetical protein
MYLVNIRMIYLRQKPHLFKMKTPKPEKGKIIVRAQHCKGTPGLSFIIRVTNAMNIVDA